MFHDGLCRLILYYVDKLTTEKERKVYDSNVHVVELQISNLLNMVFQKKEIWLECMFTFDFKCKFRVTLEYNISVFSWTFVPSFWLKTMYLFTVPDYY